MFKVLVPAVAALGLVAFAAQSRTDAFGVEGRTSAPVMGWSLHHEGALAKLAYGVADSDQLALMASCLPGETTVALYGDVQIEGARPAATTVSYDPLSGGDAEETRIAVSDPSLRGLAERGRMTVVGDAGPFQLTATPHDRRLVGDFLAYCSAGRA